MTTIYRKKHKMGDVIELRPGRYEVTGKLNIYGDTGNFTIKPLTKLPKLQKPSSKLGLLKRIIARLKTVIFIHKTS